MLSDEEISSIARRYRIASDRLGAISLFARAIEAAVLPEGWKELLQVAIFQMEMENWHWESEASTERRRNAHAALVQLSKMLAAVPKPAQCNCQQGQVCPVCDPDLVPAQAEKQEPVNDEPVALHHDTADLVNRFSQAMREKLAKAERKYGYSNLWANCDWMDECRAKLVEHLHKGDPLDVANYCAFLWHHGEHCKQEPVKDAPVAWRFSKGTITKLDSCPHGGNWQPLYTRPQPDLTAEVERLKLSAEHWNRLYREKCQEFHDAQANKGQEIVWLIDRIAALEEAARQARDAFEQHDGNYKLSKASGAVVEAAIAKLDAVLGGRP